MLNKVICLFLRVYGEIMRGIGFAVGYFYGKFKIAEYLIKRIMASLL